MSFDVNKMDGTRFVSLVALALLVFAAAASATYITLSPALSLERIVSGNETQVNVSIANLGDEPAYEVQLSFLLPEGFDSEPIYFGRVDNGAVPQRGGFLISIQEGVSPGKYTAALLTEYKDANGYPFSSVSPYPLFIEEIRSSQVSGAIKETELGTKETTRLFLELRNLDERAHNVEISIRAPKELKVSPMDGSTYIESRGEATKEFEISSFGALAGSSYVVFASLDYEEDGSHYSATASGMVKVVEKKDPFSFSGWLPVAAIVVLVLAALVYQFRK